MNVDDYVRTFYKRANSINVNGNLIDAYIYEGNKYIIVFGFVDKYRYQPVIINKENKRVIPLTITDIELLYILEKGVGVI